MFSKLAVFVASAFALSALAAPGGPVKSNDITNSCNVGTTYCCNSVQKADSAAAQKAIGGLNLVDVLLGSITGQVGLTCDPISAVVGIGGNSCSSQPTCCTGNNFNGAVVVGCSPINANL